MKNHNEGRIKIIKEFNPSKNNSFKVLHFYVSFIFLMLPGKPGISLIWKYYSIILFNCVRRCCKCFFWIQCSLLYLYVIHKSIFMNSYSRVMKKVSFYQTSKRHSKRPWEFAKQKHSQICLVFNHEYHWIMKQRAWQSIRICKIPIMNNNIKDILKHH